MPRLRSSPRSRRARFLARFALPLAACAPPPSPTAFPPYAVRGRWPTDEVRVRVPADDPLLVRASRAAAEVWNRAGVDRVPRVVLVAPHEEADVDVAFERGAHGRCPAFGVLSAVAHSGPPSPPSFVHVDADRRFTTGRESAAGSHSLPRVLAHEFGHLLGLDHVDDPGQLMHVGDPAPGTPLRLGLGDRHALRTLYGDCTDFAANDLLLVDEASGRVLCALRGIEAEDFGFADVDGDGDDELCAWTSAAATPAFCWFDFAAAEGSLRPRRSVGPLFGLVATHAELSFARDVPHGRRLFVLAADDGAFAALPLDASGNPRDYIPAPLELEDGRVDLDADGRFDTEGDVLPLGRRRRGDVDGDGTPERVRRSNEP